MKNFGLKIKNKAGRSTNAYIQIRWKTHFEKSKKKMQKSVQRPDSDSKTNDMNNISKFIQSECTISVLKSDFILVEELKDKYNEYCNENRIKMLDKSSIVGCPELESLGAKFEEDFSIPYVYGITERVVPIRQNTNYISGIVRQKEQRSHLTAVFRWIDKQIVSKYFRSDTGIVINFFSVFLYLVVLTAIPLLLLVAFVWSLLEVNVIRANIYEQVFTLNNAFNSSGYEFWLNNMEKAWVFYAMIILCAVYMFFGLLELIFFFATSQRDTGKYLVIKTWPRWFISTLFWIMLLLFLGLYVAYLSVICIWSILGAVLNPEKFLPIAAGAVVILGVIIFLYARLTRINKILNDVVNGTVNEELRISLFEMLQKQNSTLGDIMSVTNNLPQIMFHRGVNIFMIANNHQSVERSLTDEILQGNASAISNLLHKN